jgi:outer membrane murein-binding lipoprotein Lpp
MTTTKRSLAAVSVLLLGGAVALWLVQRQSQSKLQDRINALQAQVEQLNQQRTEDARPSGQFPQTNAPLPNEELHELLKLRSEVGLLRQQTNELLKLLAHNHRLSPAQASGKPQGAPNLAAGDLVPVASLAFAGYATPEATFQSTLSADLKGDSKAFLQGFTPERKQEEEKGLTGKSETDLAARTAERAAHFDGASVRILNSKLLSDDEAELTIFTTAEKEKNLVTLTMKKIDGEWKISADKH